MHIGLISLILLFGLLLLLALGMPLGFASGFMAVAVLLMKFGPDALFGNFGSGVLNILFKRMYDLTSTYALVAVPLFILMAAFLERSGIARDMYDCLGRWLNRTRGGVAVATSLMAVVMAAMSGIVGGEVVLLGLLALPQMLRLGYDKNLAVGVICASGTLGTMIPPSVVLIMYGLITETSITALFTGAFAPGFLLASFYVVYILIRTRMQPHLAPLPPPSPDDLSPKQKLSYGGALASMALILWFAVSLARLLSPDKGGESPPPDAWHFPALMIALAAGWLFFSAGKKTIGEAWQAGRGLMAPGIVVFVVLGSIYGGITTITEAAGMGVMAVLILVLLRGEFSLRFMRESLLRTFKSTGVIMWVTFGATALAGAYTIAGGPSYVANLITEAELPALGVLIAMMLLLLALGAFMDWVGIVLLTMPVFLPIVQSFPAESIGLFGALSSDADVRVWFGVLFCMNMQVSFLSPPFGPAAFYLKSVAPPSISLPDIFRGFAPFIALQITALSLLLLFPELTTVFRS